jgi:hypothetical protein
MMLGSRGLRILGAFDARDVLPFRTEPFAELDLGELRLRVGSARRGPRGSPGYSASMRARHLGSALSRGSWNFLVTGAHGRVSF